MIIQSLIETPDEVDRAAAHQGALTRLIVAAGGAVGPGSIGSFDPDPAADANAPAADGDAVDDDA
jgi:hypothetical protein